MRARLYAVIGAIVLILSASSAFAQTGGSVIIGAIDSSTGATVPKTGDATNSAFRVRIVASDVASGGTSSSFGSALPAAGTAAGYSDGTNMQAARVVDLDTGAGSQYGLITNLVRRASGGSVELIGQATMANSLPVTFASDQSVLGANLSQIAGVTTATGNGVVGTGVQRVAIASDNTAFSVNAVQSGTWTMQPGNTANTTPWLVASKPFDACGTTTQDFVGQLTATTLTTITSTLTCVDYIQVVNVGSAATTVLAQDVSTSCSSGVCSPIPTTTLAPNGAMTFSMNGLKWTGGIKLQANNANAIQYFIHGRQ
jgi:hypothetical protein